MDHIDTAHLPHNTLKDIGNGMFAAARYREAVQYYTQAILKQPDISSYYSNRALCYVQMHEYAKALPDCRRSIELDERNLKAYFFAGQAHLGLGQWEEALAKLLHAHNLALEQHRDFGDDITSVIRLAKRKRFEAEDEKRRMEEIALQTYLNNLILQDAERQKQALIQATKRDCPVDPQARHASDPLLSPQPTDHITTPSAAVVDAVDSVTNSTRATTQTVALTHPDGKSLTEPQVASSSCVQVHAVDHELPSTEVTELPVEVRAQLSKITSISQQRIAEVNHLFSQVDERRRKREVPEYLCGRISFELMLDPVITPSGITYDKRSILTHLHRVGHFDPLTRQPLSENQLIPNLSMKEVVHAFLEENPWAENY